MKRRESRPRTSEITMSEEAQEEKSVFLAVGDGYLHCLRLLSCFYALCRQSQS